MPPPFLQHLSHILNYWPTLKALARLRLHHLICLIMPFLGNPRLHCFFRPFPMKRKCVADDSMQKHRWVYWEKHIRLVDVSIIYYVWKEFRTENYPCSPSACLSKGGSKCAYFWGEHLSPGSAHISTSVLWSGFGPQSGPVILLPASSWGMVFSTLLQKGPCFWYQKSSINVNVWHIPIDCILQLRP